MKAQLRFDTATSDQPGVRTCLDAGMQFDDNKLLLIHVIISSTDQGITNPAAGFDANVRIGIYMAVMPVPVGDDELGSLTTGSSNGDSATMTRTGSTVGA